MACSAPADCAEIERRRATGDGLLVDGGSSRGNLLSGEADEVILTVSRMEAEKRANPGYRAFFANGFNVTRALVLFGWEVVLEWTAALRAVRRDVRPRGHRGGIYPFMRGRDVRRRARPDRLRRADRHDARPPGRLRDLLELRRGRAPLRASSAPTRWRRCASSTSSSAASTAPAATRRARTRSWCSPTTARRRARPSSSATATGSTISCERSLERGAVAEFAGGDEQSAMVGHALNEATGRQRAEKTSKNDVSGRTAVVLGSGNLGLVYLMEEQPPPDARGDRRAAPAPDPGASRAPARRLAAGALRRARRRRARRRAARTTWPRGASRARTRSPPFSPTAPAHLLRTDGFAHVADIMVGSFYDPELDEGCAFEELISFHGGLGGPADPPVHPAPGRTCRCRPSRSSAPSRCTGCCRAGGAAGPARAGRGRVTPPAGGGRPRGARRSADALMGPVGHGAPDPDVPLEGGWEAGARSSTSAAAPG